MLLRGKQLDRKGNTPNRTGRIADADHQIMRDFAHQSACLCFFSCLRPNGICTRRINTAHTNTVRYHPALGAGDGLSAPVSGMLMQTCQCIENGTFPDIRIACKHDRFGVRQRPDENPCTFLLPERQRDTVYLKRNRRASAAEQLDFHSGFRYDPKLRETVCFVS